MQVFFILLLFVFAFNKHVPYATARFHYWYTHNTGVYKCVFGIIANSRDTMEK